MSGQGEVPRARPSSALASEILAWTEGWARSRRVQPPTPIAGGVYLQVGSPTEAGRYILTVADPAQARAATATVREADFWIKWPAAPHEAEPSMPAGWRLVARQYLMGARLERSSPPLPAGYRLEVSNEEDAVEARLLTVTGELAASGRIGLTEIAVPDQIVTQGAHRRRGLGRVIMSSLSHAALDRGRGDALLLASGQGRHLYVDLGWRVLAPFWAAFHRG